MEQNENTETTNQARPDSENQNPEVGVEPNVRAKALSVMQQFRFTVKTPIQNHGVEIGYSGYPDYDPMKYDIYHYTIIAFSFDDAIEMVRASYGGLSHNIVRNHIVKVERIDEPIFIDSSVLAAPQLPETENQDVADK